MESSWSPVLSKIEILEPGALILANPKATRELDKVTPIIGIMVVINVFLNM